jgi:hypothetical protein
MKKYTLFVVFILVSLWSRAQLPGNSVQLKANGNYISVVDASSVSLNDTMTIEMMVYFRCNNAQSTMLMTKGWCGSNWSYYFSVNDQKLRLAKWHAGLTGCAGNHAIFESTDSIELNTWTHVAVRIVDLNVDFIINGVDAGSTLLSGTNGDGFHTSNQPIRIGSYLNISSVHQNTPLANLDEVRIWHTARTDAELLANMNQELTGNEPGLKAYYKLNETGSGAGISVINSATGSLLPNGTTAGTAANLEFNNNTAIQNGLPNCDPILWLKADAGITVNGSNQVTQWADQSGNNNHAVSDGTTLPTLLNNTINNLPVVNFSDDRLATPLVNLTTTNKADVFVVYKGVGAGAFTPVEFCDDYNVVTTGFAIADQDNTCPNCNNDVSINIHGNIGYNQNALNQTQGCPKIINAVLDKSLSTEEAKVWLNGVLQAKTPGTTNSDNTNNFGNHKFYLGKRSANCTYCPGVMGDFYYAELIVFPRVLTSKERTSIFKYLNNKYFVGTGASFSGLPSSTNYNSTIYDDISWKHTFNSSNATQVIASIKDYCLDLGTRSDTVYVEANPVQIGTGYAMRRHYTINTSLNPAGTKRVRLYYTNADFTNLQTMVPGLTSHSQLVVTKYDGPNEDGIFNTTGGSLTFIPSAQITTGTAFGQRYLEFDVSDFSEFWIHAGSVPLPVDILTFHANPCNTQACLQWTVGEEKNVSHYEVERSLDGNSFQFVGKVNATNESSYSFTDNMPYAGRNYYRLNVVDIDGKHNYSPIRSIDFTEGQWNIAILPTFSENGQYTLQSNKSIRSVEIFTTNGSLVQTIHNPSQNLNLSGLSSGMYFIKVSTSAESEVLKVMK